MPPRSAPRPQRTKTSSKSSSSKSNNLSETESATNRQNPTQSNVPDGDESLKPHQSPRPGRELFDLNEPFCEWADEADGSKEEILMKSKEDEVKEGESVDKGVGDELDTKPAVKEKRKQKEYEVFVGGLHRDAIEEDLNEVFKRVGEVVEVRLVKSRHSNKNKGFAFVRFATVEQAKRAASELNYTQVLGKICEVTRNNDNETLHLRNICTTWTKDQLVEHLRPFELENLEDVHLIDDPNDRTKNRGYAFLNFCTHMDAVAACSRLQKEGDIYFGTNIRAEVAFAKSAIEPDEEVMAQVKSVFLDGLPANWDEEQVLEKFKKYGEIENVQLARNMPSAKRKDFGFISYSTREAALACIDAANKDGIGEGANKIFLKATLRKPLQKRMPSAVGGWRGYSSKSHDVWGPRLHTGHSYSSRPSRTVESMGWDHERRSGGFNRYSTRDACGREFSPVEKYDSQLRRSVRRAPAANSRSRDPYHESSSSSRHYFGDYEDFTPSYPLDDRVAYAQAPSRGRYEDGSYYFQYEYSENSSEDGYEYPPPSGLKRHYSAIDYDQLVSRSLTRHAGIGGSGLEMDAYPAHDVFMYEEYSRSVRGDRYGYNSPGYDNRHVSRNTAPRTYRY